MNTLKEEWEGFTKLVFRGPISHTQYTEMQRAFYAGATTIIGIMLKIALKDISDEAGAAILEGLRQECISFSRNLRAKT